VAGQGGFTFRHAAGLDMLLPPGETRALNAVHLVFAGEMVKPNQAAPNPPLRPERLAVHGIEVAVIPVFDLAHMKLGSNRDIDRVHIRDLDSVELITVDIENALPSVLRERLREIRSKE